jgi:hypothetical protein
MEINTVHLLHEYSAIPYHVRDKRLDLPRLLEPYKGNVRYLIASPKLFPFTTLMIATHVFGQHTMRPVAATADVTVQRSSVPISFNMGLLVLALDRLLKCQGAVHDTRDALLTLVFAMGPEPDGMREPTPAYKIKVPPAPVRSRPGGVAQVERTNLCKTRLSHARRAGKTRRRPPRAT